MQRHNLRRHNAKIRRPVMQVRNKANYRHNASKHNARNTHMPLFLKCPQLVREHYKINTLDT